MIQLIQLKKRNLKRLPTQQFEESKLTVHRNKSKQDIIAPSL
jgi:hypothetical protein